MKYTVGELIDRLCIENIRLWMLQDEEESAEVLKKIKQSNKMRNKWMAAIDKELKQDGFIKEKTY